jgi:nucleotide-binding universal stress UspA family protein
MASVGLMTDIRPGATVVVGIDGSNAALHAADWAVDEAVARDVPLRLICVAPPEPVVRPTSDPIPLEIEYAETVLRQASAAIQSTGKAVKVETAIVRGDPAAVLLAESDDAEMVCVGSTGIGAVSRIFLGSKAAALAEAAHCPIAIIRHHEQDRPADRSWIAVGVTACTEDDDVVMAAMAEARLRHVPLLVIGLWHKDFGYTPYDELDRLAQSWRERYPDVHVYPVSTRAGLVSFLNDDDDPIGLVVIGADDAGRVAEIIGPHSHPILGHRECSVLIVRR